MARRKIRSAKFSKRRTIVQAAKTGKPISLACQTGCGRIVIDLPADTRAVTCAYCTAALIEPPEGYGQVKPDRTGWPRGWHLRKVFDAPDGKTYNRGKEAI